MPRGGTCCRPGPTCSLGNPPRDGGSRLERLTQGRTVPRLFGFPRALPRHHGGSEQAPLLALSERRDTAARDAEVAIVPGVGFYGGPGDLLTSTAAAHVARPTEVSIAYAVDGWLLTAASRATAAVVAGPRWVWREGRLEFLTGEPSFGSFDFPGARGTQAVMKDYPLPEAISVPRHVDVPALRLVMTVSTLAEVFAADAPAPEAVSDSQRADSRFSVVAVVSDESADDRRAFPRVADVAVGLAAFERR